MKLFLTSICIIPGGNSGKEDKLLFQQKRVPNESGNEGNDEIELLAHESTRSWEGKGGKLVKLLLSTERSCNESGRAGNEIRLFCGQ